MNNEYASKRAPDECTHVEGRKEQSGVHVRSVNRGFNAGECNMFSNPVEQELRFIQAAMEKQAALEERLGVRTSTRHDLRELLKKVA